MPSTSRRKTCARSPMRAAARAPAPRRPAPAAAPAAASASPTTERNLGDGIVPAALLLGAGVRISLGTDSHTQIDLLEDARELEYHLRLQKLERAVLAPEANARTTDATAQTTRP